MKKTCRLNRNRGTRFICGVLSFFTTILYHPLLVYAEEAVDAAESEAAEEMSPITAIIGLIVLVVVAYKVYHLMYDGSVMIGTRQGLAYGFGRRLAIPVICGGVAAAVVIKILDFLGSILAVLFIVAFFGGGIYGLYSVFAGKKKKTPDSDPAASENGNNDNGTDQLK